MTTTINDLLACAAAYVRDNLLEDRATEVIVRLESGHKVRHPVRTSSLTQQFQVWRTMRPSDIVPGHRPNSPTENIILQALTGEGWLTGQQLAEACGLPRSTLFNSILSNLAEAGVIESSTRNGYRLAEPCPVPCPEPQPAPLPAVPPAEPATPALDARHSVDFRSVRWFGIDYTFTPTQAAVVKSLWENWENETPDVGQDAILEGAGSECDRLRDLFRNHPAWGTLIVPTGSANARTYRLAEPSPAPCPDLPAVV